MAKKINAYVDSNTNRIVIISDDVQNGDYIDLNSLSSIQEYIENSINKNHTLKEKLFNEFKLNSEFQLLKKDSELLKEANFEISKLKQQMISNQENIINQFKNSNEYQELINKNNKLLTNYQLLEQKYNLDVQNAVNKYISSSEHQKLITELAQVKNELNNMQKNIPNIKNDAIKEYKDSLEYKKLENELEDYKKKIDIRNSLNIKKIGESLETFCFNEYNSSMGQYVDDCVFKKTTNPISGSMPDFVFEVYGKDKDKNIQLENKDYLLGKVVLEMKSESLSSDEKNKKTNLSHLPKLEKDRENFGADIAILVTELESDNDFIIQKPINYPNIIIIRPQVLSPLLNILRNLYLKQNEIVVEQINFKSSKEILDSFHDFKQSIIDNAVEHIKNKLLSIIKSANSILSQAESILEAANLALNNYVERIIKKINDFKIDNKVIKKINKLSTNSNNENLMVASSKILDEGNIIKEKIKS